MKSAYKTEIVHYAKAKLQDLLKPLNNVKDIGTFQHSCTN